MSWQSFPWNGLKLQLRIASIVYQDERYEEAIAHLPWPGAGWDNGSAWAADVAQLLWPKISLKTDDDAESWYTRLNVPGPGQATSTSTSTPMLLPVLLGVAAAAELNSGHQLNCANFTSRGCLSGADSKIKTIANVGRGDTNTHCHSAHARARTHARTRARAPVLANRRVVQADGA